MKNAKGAGRKSLASTHKEDDEKLRGLISADLETLIYPKLRQNIKRGSQAAIQYAIDRLLGRPKDSLDMTSNGETVAVQVYLPTRREKNEAPKTPTN